MTLHPLVYLWPSAGSNARRWWCSPSPNRSPSAPTTVSRASSRCAWSHWPARYHPPFRETEAGLLITAAHAALLADWNLGGLVRGCASRNAARRGRRRSGRHDPRALRHHLPDARHRPFNQVMTPMTSIVLTQPHTHAGRLQGRRPALRMWMSNSLSSQVSCQ